MNNELNEESPGSEWQGPVIGILVFIVFIISLVDRWLGIALLPINRVVSVVTFAVLFLISGILFILSFKALSPGVALGQHRSNLNITGIYAYLRHPHYLSNMILNISIAFLFNSGIGLLIALGGVLLTYLLTRSEEEYLKQRFGTDYLEYISKVPMFIPRIKKK
jgi:protein-S-isoprenylcysteine O-methyltransferase Ste14